MASHSSLPPSMKIVFSDSFNLRDAETGTVIMGSGLGEANTVKMTSILDDMGDEVKFNQSTIGTSTKKALETASSRIVSRMITKGIFTH